jgi:hypothetical protein
MPTALRAPDGRHMRHAASAARTDKGRADQDIRRRNTRHHDASTLKLSHRFQPGLPTMVERARNRTPLDRRANPKSIRRCDRVCRQDGAALQDADAERGTHSRVFLPC